jgi:VWFA-related protein
LYGSGILANVIPGSTRSTLALVMLIPAMLVAQVQETITVARVLLDVRATEMDGEPILGLTKDDFTVTLGGKPAKVESVTWIPDTTVARVLAGVEEEEAPPPPATEDAPMPRGRLFVVFIQTDFAVATERIRGQMHFLTYAKEMVETFEPEDRVAVFSFDSHLKFRLDFTSDKDRVGNAIEDAMIRGIPPTPPVVPNPSLARRLDREEMRKAASSEAALILVGNALRHIPGPKSLLLLGWGLGERLGGQVIMSHKYTIARRVLEAARVTIFALDTTNADYHSLEVGLEKAAEDTGGFYAKTHLFADLAITRLRRTLAGHYELELRRPDSLKTGTHRVEVRVKVRGAHVLAPATWMDR